MSKGKYNVIFVNLADWTRLAEVEAYAKARDVDISVAIRELVNHGLSHIPHMQRYIADHLAGDCWCER